MTERQSARMSESKNGGLDQYGAEPFEQQQFGTAGVERVNFPSTSADRYVKRALEIQFALLSLYL